MSWQPIDITSNVYAFLTTLRQSEGTGKHPDPYRVCFGEQHTIEDFRDHPALTGEYLGYRWRGILETAAGAYQITKGTWIDIKAAILAISFGPYWQDQGALWLIENRAHTPALALVQTGQFDAAIAACSKIWASLPGSTARQPQALLADLAAIYRSHGGALA